MLLDTLASSLLRSSLLVRGLIRAAEKTIRAGQDFKYRVILELVLKYKNIIKLNLNLMVFIQEITYQKLRVEHVE